MSDARPASPHLVRRLLTAILSAGLGLWLVFDDGIGFLMRPAFARLWDLAWVRAVERWTMRLPPYAALALMIVPMIFIEPAKLIALYLIGAGHYISGICLLLVAFSLGIALVDRVFAINRQKLRSIPWVARCHDMVLRLRGILREWLHRTALWQWLDGMRRARRF